MDNIFSKIHIKKHTIKNRIVMAPMVTFNYIDESGVVTKEHVEHYEKRAKGGVGLIITEAVCINPNGRLAQRQLRFWSDEYVDGMSKIAEVCHLNGSKVIAQIHHAGLNSPKDASRDIVAPSNFDKDGILARELEVFEIHDLQKDFIHAAKRAKKAGFDGIELHGAHGYLISQFISPEINKRNDLYGGSTKNRARFASEIIEAIRSELGEEFIISIRMGSNDGSLKEAIEVAKEFERAGVDLIDVSFGFNDVKANDIEVPENFAYNWIVYGGTEMKKQLKVPVIVVNDIKTPEQANYLVENKLSDFVALGKALLVDEEWVNEAERKEPISKCFGCKRCNWFMGGSKCPGIIAKSK